jgi:hypothetical protein
LELAQSNLAIKIAIFPTILQYSREQNIQFDCNKHYGIVTTTFGFKSFFCPITIDLGFLLQKFSPKLAEEFNSHREMIKEKNEFVWDLEVQEHTFAEIKES